MHLLSIWSIFEIAEVADVAMYTVQFEMQPLIRVFLQLKNLHNIQCAIFILQLEKLHIR